ncbi:molecular chaperone DnaK [Maricaulis sp. W15]|uniref:TraR/DksA family transcriptional regulator n=1 Tax=Maricaulis sp. W15 TaxID=1772333 RepID=UPI000948F962|nr:TraR/DksA C4-type zinc finger protein [Maricaulis sp. W15]OLF81231.1 molecular chaperone DnaK [Maricaulis sp. W15]
MTPDNARARLNALRQEILDLSDASSEDRKPVELDQQSVGRLSRQDSMQVQAMAKAADACRTQELRRIDAALARIDEDEFGWCAECGEPIEEARLEIDPAAPRCSGCA